MNGEESPPKLSRRRAKGYGEFRHPFQDAPRGSAGSFTHRTFSTDPAPGASHNAGAVRGMTVPKPTFQAGRRVYSQYSLPVIQQEGPVRIPLALPFSQHLSGAGLL